MKIVLVGTKHPKEEALEIVVEYDGEDTWTFNVIGELNFTISDLQKVIKFLKSE